MSDFLGFGLNQVCTYWQRTGVDGFNQPSFAAPVTIVCRWEDRSQRIQNDEGVDVMSKARVFLAQDIAVGDYLALGLYAGANPRTVADAHIVLQFAKIPGIYAEAFERKAYL